MSWLDPLLAIKTQQAGTTAGTRQTINFASGATVTDDPANDRVNVAISATPADASTSAKGIVQLAGDIAGTATSVTVAKVNGVSVSGTPTSGQVIRATSGTASSWASVARGDITNTSGATGDLITGNATTLGRLAIGSTGQVLTVSGGVPVWSGQTRRAVDANHSDVWYMDTTTGTSFPNIVSGRPAMGPYTSNGLADLDVRTGYCFSRYSSAVYTGTNAIVYGYAATAIYSTAAQYTIEAIVWVMAQGFSSISNGQFVVAMRSLTNNADQQFRIKTFTGSNAFEFLTASGAGAGNTNETSYSYGNGAGLISLETPHHIMETSNPTGAGTGTVLRYIDGVLVQTVTGAPAGNRDSNVVPWCGLVPGMSLAEIRVSNVIRDAAYAREATRIMRGM